MKINDEILTEYCNEFLGFGHWKAPIWFIGIEEAGGRNAEEIQNRLKAWDEGGRKSLEDAPRFYPASGNVTWHGANAKIQPTWRQLIRVLLLAKGKIDTQDEILNYQRFQLGSSDGETCLLELLPLPSPCIQDWNYHHWSNLPWLQNRNSYFNELKIRRENLLRQKINQFKPKLVIFYGLGLGPDISLLPSWSSIAGGFFDQAFPDEKILLERKNEEIEFFVMRHPAAESDAYFSKIGKFLYEKFGKLLRHMRGAQL